MINVIQNPFTFPQGDEIFHRADKIFLCQRALSQFDIKPKFLIDLVPAYSPEIVLLRIEKQPLEQSARIGHRWRIARAQTAVDIFESFLFVVGRVLLDRLDDRVVILNIDHLDFIDSKRENLLNGRLG